MAWPDASTVKRRRAAVRGLLRGVYCGLLCGLLLAASPAAPAQDDGVALERRVKAAFLYKFADYVAWPEGTFSRPNAPIVIGVAGDEQVAAELDQVAAARAVDGRPLQVRRLREGDPVAGLHVLFISRAENARLLPLLRALPAQPVLVVTEAESALGQGSIINFAMAGGRVRFEIAMDNAERRGLKLSSRLLSVAQHVRTGQP